MNWTEQSPAVRCSECMLRPPKPGWCMWAKKSVKSFGAPRKCEHFMGPPPKAAVISLAQYRAKRAEALSTPPGHGPRAA